MTKHSTSTSYCTQDGETNLKIKKPVDVRAPWQPRNAADVVALHLTAHMEAPSADLHVVRGSLHVHGPGMWLLGAACTDMQC